MFRHFFGKDDHKDDEGVVVDPFCFDDGSYSWPSLLEEADEMLQVSLLIYSITDLRTLAKTKHTTQLQPILELPLSIITCLEMIQDNLDLIKSEFGDEDHAMTMSALESIQRRYQRHASSSNNNNSNYNWLYPFSQSSDSVELQEAAPLLIAYGDEKPDRDMVYAVGVDPIRKRVTVAFRGSVTPADFLTDASITLKKLPSPVNHDEREQIGIHSGFWEYLLKKRKDTGKSKFEEILQQVVVLFQDRKDYKLYSTGHSLGAALATLFSFYAACEEGLPTPVTCVSVASPRVGEGSFQRAFGLLEQRGRLRHLRIVNDRDPVTIMPKASGKKLFAMLSPVSYIAFKVSDQNFEEKETYRHTGIKLKLRKSDETKDRVEIVYSSGAKTKEETGDGAGSRSLRGSFRKSTDLPGVSFHLGSAYVGNLTDARSELEGLTLNELYATIAAPDAAECS